MYKPFKKLSSYCSLLALLGAVMLVPIKSVQADGQTPESAATAPAKVNAAVELIRLQKQLDGIKQRVSAAPMDTQLIALNAAALKLAADAEAVQNTVQTDLTQLQAQLAILGPPPAPGAMAETPVVAQQRIALNSRKTLLNAQLDHAKAIGQGATILSAQIVDIRRNALKTQMALNSGSILSPSFWSPLTNPQPEDAEGLADFRQEIHDAWLAAWEPGWRFGSASFLVLALLIWGFGARLLDKPLGWYAIHILPEGRLRRSFLACATTLSTVFSVGVGAQFIYLLFTRHPDVSSQVQTYADVLFRLTLFSALIAGLGRAFLSNHRPSWRLPTIADPVARAMRVLPLMLAAFILVLGAVEQMNRLVGTSVATTIFGNGIASLLVALTAVMAPLRTNRVRRKMMAEGAQPEARSTIVGLIQLATLCTAIAILLSLLVGYIALARFLTYELVWVGIVLSCLYLLVHLVVDLCESLFSPTTMVGLRIKHSLGLSDRHLAQAATLLSAIGKTLLILLAAMALLNGTFGSTTPMALFEKVVDMWGGKGLEKLNIVPAHVMNAIIFLAIGLYVLRSARRWLDKEFLPKTMMETGMRASLVILFSNMGYILIALLTLSMLGIQWNNLAWIVSALSVGIGFGLQEIVKNFISGIILLIERPVKVGDLITISGIEGDIRRINVRATEIQLGDRSTVIVPNSEFISQNVRNATMGNAQGVATIALTFPLDIDPEQVRNLLLETYRDHLSIQDSPAPSVNFSQLGPNGIVLSVTGFVSSPRIVATTKSELLFEILKRLRAAGVVLSMPQKMVFEHMPQGAAGIENQLNTPNSPV
jgi:small-conductance mechanosensitive channel